jgi:tRNA uridine 5-carboxymethylaminomethyl modification enzyme
LHRTWARPESIPAKFQEDTFGKALEREYSLHDLLRRPNVRYEQLVPLLGSTPADPEVAEQVEIEAKYAGYIERQKDEVARQAAQESTAIPADMDYASVRGLSREVQQRLEQHRPETVGQASRIQGITPAAIALLLVHLKRRSLAREAMQEKQA